MACYCELPRQKINDFFGTMWWDCYPNKKEETHFLTMMPSSSRSIYLTSFLQKITVAKKIVIEIPFSTHFFGYLLMKSANKYNRCEKVISSRRYVVVLKMGVVAK